MAYVVGLTATDGCLVSGRRQINFKSSDRDLVALYLKLLGRSNRVLTAKTRIGNDVYFTQFGDADWYGWLLRVGLTPRKSLSIGAIDVPDQFLLPLLRGLLDGDGTVLNKVYRADTRRRSDYYWEYLITRFTSASRAHLEWVALRVEAAVGIRGSLHEVRHRASSPKRHPFYQLTYGKRASVALLPLIYPEDAPCLERKRAIWLAYAARHSASTIR